MPACLSNLKYDEVSMLPTKLARRLSLLEHHRVIKIPLCCDFASCEAIVPTGFVEVGMTGHQGLSNTPSFSPSMALSSHFRAGRYGR